MASHSRAIGRTGGMASRSMSNVNVTAQIVTAKIREVRKVQMPVPPADDKRNRAQQKAHGETRQIKISPCHRFRLVIGCLSLYIASLGRSASGARAFRLQSFEEAVGKSGRVQ